MKNKFTVIALALSLAAFPARAQTSPCSAPGYRSLDFWVGEWDVTTPDGSPAGRSSVEKAFDGCVIIEHWTGAKGGVGMSLNTFDPTTGQWTQRWVDNGGTVAQLQGEFHDKSLIYRREFKGPNGADITSRMTFTDLGADGVRQHVERSTDGGKTWRTGFDGRYHRRAK